MKILLIGSGGREHALAWKIARSPACTKLYCAPGNGGIAALAEIVDIKSDDVDGLLGFAKDTGIDLTVVGPEAPLVKGIVDAFTAHRLRIFGPTKGLALLEGSKVYAKQLMKKFGVPTADFEVFDDSDAALRYLDGKAAPIVVKADGLCAGKGVVVCKTIDEARDAVTQMMVGKVFGPAGDRVIIEECLVGEEASILVITDGTTIVPLASSQDHKRAYDGDRGPNTGGMGAYSPAPIVTESLLGQIMKEVAEPVIRGLAAEGKPYRGVLYAGIMVTASGPKALEFNVRFGDPETQAIIPRLTSDLVDIMKRSADGDLAGTLLTWDKRPCVSVVIASGGYPGDYEKGVEIEGLAKAAALTDVIIFHAGTKVGRRATDSKKLFLTNGGRVLNVTALGATIEEAIATCYRAVGMIHFERMHYRRDIGHRAVSHQPSALGKKPKNS